MGTLFCLLLYLSNWQAYVDRHTDLSADAKRKMMLSRETLEGLRITGKLSICTRQTQLNSLQVNVFMLQCNPSLR